jgi:hypothetical protein
MISYLIDGVLLVALAVTGWRVGLMYRELRRLRGHHREYQRVFDDTGMAVEVIETAVRDINAHGAQILLALGERIDEAYRAVDEIDMRMDAVAEHFEAQRNAESNILPFATYPGTPRPQPRYEEPAPTLDREGDERSIDARRRTEEPVQWPTLGERFNQWRNSDRPMKAAAQRR